MSSSTLNPVSEYLSTSYRPDRDYIDGVVLERNLGEKSHGRVQKRLIAYFTGREEGWNIDVYPEQRVQVTSTRFRIPDLTVLVGPFSNEGIVTNPPFLCVEILSKDDTMNQMQERIDDYLRFGVTNIWIVDPRTRRCFACDSSGMREMTGDLLTTSSPHIAVPLQEVFR